MRGEDKTETDETTSFCLLRKLPFSYGSRFFNSGVQKEVFLQQAAVGWKESNVNQHIYFLSPSRTVPPYNNLQDQSGGFMVASQRERPVQGFQFLTGNTGTHLIQPQIGWTALAFPGRWEGTGSDCSAVCCFLIMTSGLRAWMSWSSWKSYMRSGWKVTEVIPGSWRIRVGLPIR